MKRRFLLHCTALFFCCFTLFNASAIESKIPKPIKEFLSGKNTDVDGAEILGGVNIECTVLFSDVRGFTTLTEQLGASGTVTLLNEYFTLMVDCIQQENGILDKFIGDVIMAAFGIPVSHDDGDYRAVRAGIAMMETLNNWNLARAAEGRLPVNIGVGLNTDTMVSGNIGSNRRMDFTIIGDGVNLASHQESACKQYGAKILISEFTQGKLWWTYRQREIDLVVVNGKAQPASGSWSRSSGAGLGRAEWEFVRSDEGSAPTQC